MKKRSLLILAITVISIISIFTLYNRGKSTIEKAIDSSNPKEINILHKEKIEDGFIVFYNRFESNDLSACFIKDVIGGWKYIYGGGQTDINAVSNRLGGVSEVYLPPTKNTPYSLFFGTITNSDITKVEIVEGSTSTKIDAKIISEKSMRIWFNYNNDFQGNDFKIIGLTENDEKIVTIKANTEAESRKFPKNPQ